MCVLLGSDQHLPALLLHLYNFSLFGMYSLDHFLEPATYVTVLDSEICYLLELRLYFTAMEVS